MSLPGPLREGIIWNMNEKGGVIKLTDKKGGGHQEVSFLLKNQAHLELSLGNDSNLLLKHGLNGSQKTSPPTKRSRVICLISKLNRNIAYRWAITNDYLDVIEERRTKKEALKVGENTRQQLLDSQAVIEKASVIIIDGQKLGKPLPQGLQKAVVVDMDRQRGIGHAKMGCGMTICFQVATFHNTITTGNSQKPYDVGKKANCPSIRKGNKIIFYLPEINPPKREHPRPTKWALAQIGDRRQKAHYRNKGTLFCPQINGRYN